MKSFFLKEKAPLAIHYYILERRFMQHNQTDQSPKIAKLKGTSIQTIMVNRKLSLSLIHLAFLIPIQPLPMKQLREQLLPKSSR
jgi:hypothetical protein